MSIQNKLKTIFFKKRTIALSIFVLTFNGCQIQTKEPSKASPLPNFIIFIADDVSWDDLGCYGNKQVETPHIDALAKDGLIFQNAYLTTSSCSPSRNSIITGRYPHNTGAAELHTSPPPEMISLPEILKSKGYYTLQAGKFHMGDYAKRGFDEVHENGKINGPGGEGFWDQAVGNLPDGQPFFLWLAAYDAHREWGQNQFSGTHLPDQIQVPEYLIDGPQTRQDLAHYYDEITRFDHHVGSVVKQLKEKGIYQNTLIIIMADNGRPFPHSKTRVNDRGVKTPFIVHYPKINNPEYKLSLGLISAVDIAPTIADMAEIGAVNHFQGVSFKKLLLNSEPKFRNYVFAEHNWHDYEAHERMVRNDRYMYIVNSRPQFAQRGPLDAINSPSYKELKDAKLDGIINKKQAEVFLAPRPTEELYDLSIDPYQFNNLLQGDSLPTAYEDLKEKLHEWREATGDDLPEKLTLDWYYREPVNSDQKDSSGKMKSNKTSQHGIRGAMPGEASAATKINNKGPL
jgi:N-sulfoglucosamine sulfohydrolase